jgi:hypothetical protein
METHTGGLIKRQHRQILAGAALFVLLLTAVIATINVRADAGYALEFNGQNN